MGTTQLLASARREKWALQEWAGICYLHMGSLEHPWPCMWGVTRKRGSVATLCSLAVWCHQGEEKQGCRCYPQSPAPRAVPAELLSCWTAPISPACWGASDLCDSTTITQRFLLGFIPNCKATYGQKTRNCSALGCRSQRPKYLSFFHSGNFQWPEQRWPQVQGLFLALSWAVWRAENPTPWR